MTTFLLDQNVNKKSLARRCNQEGKAVVKRFPTQWKNYADGFKDPQLLPIVMADDKPLLTNDQSIASDHANIIPSLNPGIIIVGNPPRHIRPLGKGEIENIIAEFKERFPSWHSVSWSNSVVQITRVWVAVSHIDSGTLLLDERIAYDVPDWAVRLENHLEMNSKRAGNYLS